VSLAANVSFWSDLTDASVPPVVLPVVPPDAPGLVLPVESLGTIALVGPLTVFMMLTVVFMA
jgi:hypothetical protein